jgi:hypothetical protein
MSKCNFYFETEGVLIYKAKQFMVTKKNSKKILHILEDGASGVQVGDIKQVILYFFFKYGKLHKIDDLLQNFMMMPSSK